MPPDLASFQRQFANTIDQPVAGGIAVYRNTVIHGAVEALAANYPVVAQIVGEEMFEGIAVEFAAAYPPRTPVLALYGELLAEWIKQQPWTADLPYLSDVARVERLHVESLVAADGEALTDTEVRAAFLTPNARLNLHPAVRFTWLMTPAMSIWLAHKRPLQSEIAPEWKAEGALFSRPEPFVMHTPRIGRAAHRLLFGIRIGATVNESVLATARLYPEEDCTAVFASLVNLGVFVAPYSRRN